MTMKLDIKYYTCRAMDIPSVGKDILLQEYY